MASQTWLESSLRRSSRLGLEVLERARRRSVDWSSANPSIRRDQQGPGEEEVRDDPAHTSLDKAFATIVEFMAQTNYECKNFYKSAPLAEPTERERTHVCRYHSQQMPRTAKQTTTTTTTKRKHVPDWPGPEDFLIEVSPGTYAITAGMQDASPQTQVVRINAGESKNLTFDL